MANPDDEEDPQPPPDVSPQEAYEQLMDKIASGEFDEDPDEPWLGVARGNHEWLGVDIVHSSDADGGDGGAAEPSPDPDGGSGGGAADEDTSHLGTEEEPRNAGSGDPWEHLDDVPPDLEPPEAAPDESGKADESNAEKDPEG